MSKFDDKLALYNKSMAENTKTAVDGDLLRKVAKGLGPSIYLKDASLVSCNDETELTRVKTNFLIKKLGLSDEGEMDSAIKAVCDEYSARMKHRPVFYYLLVKKLGKESIYG